MNNDKPLVSFDYAIKYLLKDKGDYGIVEGFISALLKTKGYKDIKIVALLETESNKEDSKSKRSLADLIVEDEDHHKYIIEIERNVKDSFIHKACFNTSRLIVDNLAQREDYTQIIKIFHISLLYFPIGNGNGAIYHGKTIIHEKRLMKNYLFISRIRRRAKYLTLPIFCRNIFIYRYRYLMIGAVEKVIYTVV